MLSLSHCPVAGLRLAEADPALGLETGPLHPLLCPLLGTSYLTSPLHQMSEAVRLQPSPERALPGKGSSCRSRGSPPAFHSRGCFGAPGFVVREGEQTPSPAPSLDPGCLSLPLPTLEPWAVFTSLKVCHVKRDWISSVELQG